MTPVRERMLDDLRIRNYSPSPSNAISVRWRGFAKHFGKSPEHLGPEEIRLWQLFLLNEKKAKTSSYIWKNYPDGNQSKEMKLDAVEFIRRFRTAICGNRCLSRPKDR